MLEERFHARLVAFHFRDEMHLVQFNSGTCMLVSESMWVSLKACGKFLCTLVAQDEQVKKNTGSVKCRI